MSRAREVANLGSDTTNLEDISSAYNAGALSNRNKIINGAMVIDQRNAGASVTPTDLAYTLDRWQARQNVASKYSAQQSSTAPSGFSNSLLVTSLSAYSVVSTNVFYIRQNIEGFNVADLGWGTASAQTVTISFWVRSSLTGSFGGAVNNSAVDRSYPFSYTINAADTWEKKAITIAGDTSGTWVTNSGVGVRLVFGLGIGPTLSGTAGAWAAGAFYAPTGATSVVGTNGATFYITGVQLEAGDVSTPFEHRSYGQELALCQRYFEKSFKQNDAIGSATPDGRAMIITGTATNSAIARSVEFSVEKRAAPTMSTWDRNGNSGKITTFDVATAATENVTPSVPFGEISTKAARIGHIGSSISGFAFSWAAASEL